jgi:hypothetical protein
MADTLPGKYDNVCITSGELAGNYFTCYTRPAAPVYNDKYGVYRDFNPKIDEDTLAFDIAPDIPTFCSGYNANTIKVIRGITSTNVVYNKIIDGEAKRLQYLSLIGNLITSKCTPPPTGMDDECTQLDTMYQQLKSPKKSLTDAKSATKSSLDTLSNISTQIYSIYNNGVAGQSVCDALPGYILSPSI